MPLPISGPLSINDIRIELQQAQANSSLDALSNLAGFTNPDSISEFYGFSFLNYNTFSINSTNFSSTAAACAGGPDNLTLFFAGSGGTPACPAVGVTLFTNSTLVTPFDGNGRFFKTTQCGAAYRIANNTGVIISITPC